MTEHESLNYFREKLSNGQVDDELHKLAKETLENHDTSSTLKKLAAKVIWAKEREFSEELLQKSAVYAAYLEVLEKDRFEEELEKYLERSRNGDSLDQNALLILTTFVQRAAKLKKISKDQAKGLLLKTIRFVESRSEDLLHLLKSCINAIRVNTVRTWIGRMTSNKSHHQVLLELISELENIVHAENKSIDLWPPSSSNELENLSSVSADWSWIESTSSTSFRDRSLYASLTIASGLMQNLVRTKSKQIDGLLMSETLLAGLKWHSPTIRRISIKLLSLIDEKSNFFACLKAANDSNLIKLDVKQELSSFPLDNCDTENEELFETILNLLPKIEWSQGQLQEWTRILRSQCSTEESLIIAIDVLQRVDSSFSQTHKSVLTILCLHESSAVRHRAMKALEESLKYFEALIDESIRIYGSSHEVTYDLLKKTTRFDDYMKRFLDKDELDQTHLLLWNCEEVVKKIDDFTVNDWIERIEQLLRYSGSSMFPECPQFSDLATNLSKQQLKPVEFAHLLLNYQKLILNSVTRSDDEEKKWEWSMKIWQSLIRTRHKTVVDLGTELIPKMLKTLESKRIIELFEMAENLLFSVNAKTRTLTITKTLWACCEAKAELFGLLWDKIQEYIKTNLNPTVTARILKIVKYFLAREQCPWSAANEILKILFEKCLLIVENEEDFLVRSAATILFGFVTNLMTRKRELFYFELLIDTWKPIFQIIYKTFAGKKEYSKEYRMLVLAFLSKFRFGTPLLYSKQQICFCNHLSKALLTFLSILSDVRASRATLECIAGLIAYVEVEPLLQKLLEDNAEDFTSHAQKAYFIYTLKRMWSIELQNVLKTKIPYDIAETLYIRQVEEIVDATNKNELDKLCQLVDVDRFHLKWELSANAFGYAVAISSRALRDQQCSDKFRALWKRSAFEALSLSNHCSRMAARCVTEMGLARWHLQPVIAKRILRDYFTG
ncbi:unnamed protein product, partial [Mesorhabditis belari]|uniref:Uncharacterized protein n=1 Tax=Mesorhabditis belari TaxID=2138241 RepID=A0AAF3F783_9BILA